MADDLPDLNFRIEFQYLTEYMTDKELTGSGRAGITIIGLSVADRYYIRYLPEAKFAKWL